MDRIAQISPPEALVYCAHEYTAANFKFLTHIDPELCSEKYDEILKMRETNTPTVPTTLSNELRYNLFMRCRDASLQLKLGTEGNPIDTMAKLREMKNTFK
jgi:hydroxyacylglutathione hydrolase